MSLPHATVIRTKTKQRIMRKILEAQDKLKAGALSKDAFESINTSYQGVLSHSRNKELQKKIKRFF